MKFMKEKQRFSLRKYKAYGLSSALLGLTLVGVNATGSSLNTVNAYAATSRDDADIDPEILKKVVLNEYEPDEEVVSVNVEFVDHITGQVVGTGTAKYGYVRGTDYTGRRRRTYPVGSRILYVKAPLHYVFLDNYQKLYSQPYTYAFNGQPVRMKVFKTSLDFSLGDSAPGVHYNGGSNGSGLYEDASNVTITYKPDETMAAGAKRVESAGSPSAGYYRRIGQSDDDYNRGYVDFYTPGTPGITYVGTKPKVETIKRGRENVEKRTTYTVNEKTGDITESSSERVVSVDDFKEDNTLTAGEKRNNPDGSVSVGTKPKVEETPIDFQTTYEANDKADRDVRADKVAGKKGKTIKTTPYTLNKKTGDVTPGTSVVTTEPAVNRVVSVGTKPKVVTTAIPSPKRYVKDDTRDKGAKDIVEAGKEGKSVVTTTYTVNPTTGVITDTVGKPALTDPTETIVKVAAKTKVETVKEGPKTIERTTVYTVNSQTGVVTGVSSDRVLSNKPFRANPDVAAGEKGSVDAEGTTPVGTKPKVEETVIPFTTSYEANEQADRDVKTDKVVGKNGKTVKTTTYTLNEETGDVTPNEPVVTTEPAVNRVVSVGTKPTVVTKAISSPVVYEKDNERDKGAKDIRTEGKAGSSVEKTVYDLNKETGVTTPRKLDPVVTQPTKTVVKVAAKDKVVTEKIASPKKYQADETKAYGSENENVPGVDGVRTTTTVYTVNPQTGEVTEKTNTSETKPTETVVKVGTKPTVVKSKDDQGRDVTTTTTYTVDPNTGKVTPKVSVSYGNGKEPTVETTVIPSPKRYVKDDTRDKGAENVVESGKDGKKVVTTEYKVNEQTGEVTPVVGKPVVTEPTETVVKVAAKDKVVTEEISPEVTYERDDAKEKGSENETTEGEKGIRTITTTYDVNPETGEITEHTGDAVVTKQAGKTVVKVGTKPVVELVRENGKTIRRTTRFELDERTGQLTSVTTDELVSSNNPDGVNPPVVDISEYTGAVGGSLDGNGNVVLPPVVEKPNYEGKIEPTVERTVILAKKRFAKDDTRSKGEPDVTVEGKDGFDEVITTYEVQKDGTVVPSKGSVVHEDAVDTVVKVAAKDEVETFERDGKVYERITSYEVDENTGEITSSTEERYVKDVEQPKKELPTVSQKQLPNTGDASMVLSAGGMVLMGIGALARPKRKK